MIQVQRYTVEEVFAAMENRGVLSDGHKFRPNSARLVLFKEKGIVCVECEIVGEVFILETHKIDVKPHLNLYAKDKKGNLVLMTKDHIHPKSKGGANEQFNYQPMCRICNCKKSDKVETVEKVLVSV